MYLYCTAPSRYLGIKMYLVRLRNPPPPKVDWGVANIASLALASAGINSPLQRRAKIAQ